jgi:hypothetical protein
MRLPESKLGVTREKVLRGEAWKPVEMTLPARSSSTAESPRPLRPIRSEYPHGAVEQGAAGSMP